MDCGSQAGMTSSSRADLDLQSIPPFVFPPVKGEREDGFRRGEKICSLSSGKTILRDNEMLRVIAYYFFKYLTSSPASIILMTKINSNITVSGHKACFKLPVMLY